MPKDRSKYRIGTISELMGITPEALRYYEHEGIITPEKVPGSGYRLYTAWDLHILIRSRAYQSYGCTLAEATHALDDMTLEEIDDLLDEKARALEADIARRQLILKQIRHDSRELIDAQANIGKFRIEHNPAMHFIETQDSYKIIDGAMDLYQAWIERIPHATSGGLFEENVLHYGMIAEDASLETESNRDFIFERTIPIPPQVCIGTYFRSGSEYELCIDMFKPAFDFMEAHGLEVAGSPFARAVMMTRDEHGAYHSIYRGWVPCSGDSEFCNPMPLD